MSAYITAGENKKLFRKVLAGGGFKFKRFVGLFRDPHYTIALTCK